MTVDSADPAIRDSGPAVFAASDFVTQSCARDPQLLQQLSQAGDLRRALSAADFAARAPQLQADTSLSEAQLMAELRRWRRREMVRIAWRDLAGWATLDETLAELSRCSPTPPCHGAYASRAAARWWRAMASRARPVASVQPLVVFGMGKLGGGELNFSSDIDLVFLFPEHGETDGARRIENEEFFTRSGQALIRLLGCAAPPRASCSASTCACGRSATAARWSRASRRSRTTCSARPRLGALRLDQGARGHRRRALRGAVSRRRVRPFVYRRYLDYGVFEACAR